MKKSAILLAVAIMLVNSTAYAEVRKAYYESGQLQAEENYKYGKQEGIAKYYHESGQVREEAFFMNGVMVDQKKYDEIR
jgi:antitoxin component YwqK of YwqJK toxin-antitoxin module